MFPGRHVNPAQATALYGSLHQAGCLGLLEACTQTSARLIEIA